MPSPELPRRVFFTTLAVGLASLGAGPVLAQAALIAPPAPDPLAPGDPQVADDAISQRARDELDRLGPRIHRRERVAVADFGRPSWSPRLYLVDMVGGGVRRLLVAHGSGSDPDQTGFLQSFSNEIGSLASSEGAFCVLAPYGGIHGPSLRIEGLDPTNSNALKRDVVIHSADYVSPAIIEETGKLGWSEGCFAIDRTDLRLVLAELGPGHLLVSTRLAAPAADAATLLSP